MDKYYKISVFYFDEYDIYDEDKVYMSAPHATVIAKKVLNGYKEIVTNRFISERSIIDVDGPRLYDTFLGIYFTKKGITDEIRKKGYILGTDVVFIDPIEVKNLDEIKTYLEYYRINKFPKIIKKIQHINYLKQKEKEVIDNLVTEENVKKLVKEYKYGKEE